MNRKTKRELVIRCLTCMSITRNLCGMIKEIFGLSSFILKMCLYNNLTKVTLILNKENLQAKKLGLCYC